MDGALPQGCHDRNGNGVEKCRYFYAQSALKILVY